MLFAKISDTNFILKLGIFILAIFTGYLIVWNVNPALHTPLMSVTNAISGVIIVGCLISMNQRNRNVFFTVHSAIGFAGILFASINVFGGFIVTQRMIKMFKN